MQVENPNGVGQPGPILIFPGGMPRSIEFLRRCETDGQPVIGASSLRYDASRDRYPAWTFLPYVTDQGFDAALRDAVAEHGISGIYSPNPVVWNHLEQLLGKIAPDVKLVNSAPVQAELQSYRDARQRARALADNPLALGGATATVADVQLAALYRHAETIPGMCDHEKFCALHEIARSTVAGDIVEIGSWWGKSAFILARLSRLYALGNVLCVDPWSDGHLVQNDAGGMVDAASAQCSAEEAFQVFLTNLLPYAGNINYLRAPSVDGAQRYADSRTVDNGEFGATDYTGEIALLHIDGNHSFEAARDDIHAWLPMVAPGGWVIVDDYVWPYGDGPQRAGDAILASYPDHIETAFVMGSALFFRVAKSFPGQLGG